MTFWKQKQVKTRKEHTCQGCLDSLPAGSSMEYNAGLWEGEMCTYYLCIPCRDFLEENIDYKESMKNEGFMGGDIGEWRKEAEESA